MKQLNFGKLKKIRIVVSLLFFILINLIFINPGTLIPANVIDYFVSLQMIPSFLKIFFYFGITSLGLAFVILMTFGFGRVYCSTICPLGTFQDIIIHLKKKVQRQNRFKYEILPIKFHYGVLIVIVLTVLFGSTTLLNLFEPYSNYGRIVSNMIEPIIKSINNLMARLLSHFNPYIIYNIPLRNITFSIWVGSTIFFLLVGYMSLRYGRLFCNSLCPAGAILSLISRLAIFKIFIDESTCTECGLCEKVCKANCINSEKKQINFAACIGCFNCMKSCPINGIIYSGTKHLSHIKNEYLPARRKFFSEIVFPTISVAVPMLNAANDLSGRSEYSANRKYPISPPGSSSIEHYSNLCTACHLCISACPSQVLYPSFLDYGLSGLFQPKMNYDASYCNYDCTICTQVCPTGAILPLDVETKKLVQIGKAKFIKEDCVVEAKKKDCAACSEHCPTKAVYMVEYEGKLKIPKLNNDICIGCGACEHACPTSPRKAIFVTSNFIHQKAQKPKTEVKTNVFESQQDFPF